MDSSKLLLIAGAVILAIVGVKYLAFYGTSDLGSFTAPGGTTYSSHFIETIPGPALDDYGAVQGERTFKVAGADITVVYGRNIYRSSGKAWSSATMGSDSARVHYSYSLDNPRDYMTIATQGGYSQSGDLYIQGNQGYTFSWKCSEDSRLYKPGAYGLPLLDSYKKWNAYFKCNYYYTKYGRLLTPYSPGGTVLVAFNPPHSTPTTTLQTPTTTIVIPTTTTPSTTTTTTTLPPPGSDLPFYKDLFNWLFGWLWEWD